MPRSTRRLSPPRDVVVIGASLSGLFAAAAAASAGCSVTILERDELPATAQPRRGVPQGRQAHVFLHRGLLAAEELVPGLEQAMLDAGAVRVNTGRLPWFGPHGWQPTSIPTFDVLSLTRPLLEHLVRERVRARPDVEIREGVRVQGLRGRAGRWELVCANGRELSADLVVDASGRGSRMPHWLAGLGCRASEPEVVDASLGYASQLYRRPDGATLPTGLVIQPSRESPRGGLGLPVEDGGWLVAVSGYGEDRPGRDRDLRSFASSLRDPALAEVLAGLEAVGDVGIHRQTGNRRHHYAAVAGWPESLVVVGDALCAFNPIYGQGITVGACQASVLRTALGRRSWRGSRHLQRRLEAVADFPWAVATGEDRNYLTKPGPVPLGRRLTDAWTSEVGLLLLDGDRRAVETFGRVYHLMASPLELVHPALVLAVARRRRRGVDPTPAPRPPVVAELTGAAAP